MAPVDGELSLWRFGNGSRTPVGHYVETLRSLEQRLHRRRANVVSASTRGWRAELGLQIYMGPRCVILLLRSQTDRFRKRGRCISGVGFGCLRTRWSTPDHV